MKKPLLLALTLVLGSLAGTGTLRADDTLRRTQQALRDQGFYYGPIDGAPGDETTQALRRYQIRNGLAVSGKLNEETLRSLQINAPPPAAGSSAPPVTPRSDPTPPPLSGPVPPVLSGRPGKKDPPPASTPRPAPAPPTYSRPDLRADSSGAAGPSVQPLPRGAQLPSATLTEYFSGTPYEFAPPTIQADVLRRAQNALGREGFYTGAPDGAPGPRTAQALSDFQGALRLRRTGRLDEPTLRAMRLLPGPGQTPPAATARRDRQPPAPSTRRAPERDSDDEDDEDGPPVRLQRRPRGPAIFEGRIVD